MASGRFVAKKDLRSNPDGLLRKVNDDKEVCYITEDGKAKAVLLDIHQYHALCDLVEDAEAPSELSEEEQVEETADLTKLLKSPRFSMDSDAPSPRSTRSHS